MGIAVVVVQVMKRCVLLCFILAGVARVFAQDVLIQKDGSTILAKVLEVNPSDVKYKKFSNLDGPTYTILKSDIVSINYENGEQDVVSLGVLQKYDSLFSQSIKYSVKRNRYIDLEDATRSYDISNYAKFIRIEELQTKGRRSRVWGVICTVLGGIGILEGCSVLVTQDKEKDISPMPVVDLIVGVPTLFVGLSLLNNAANKSRKVRSLLNSSMIVKDIQIEDCVLSPSVELLCDKTTADVAIGAGVKITF